MCLILQVLDLRWILKATGFGSEQHYCFETSKFSRIHQYCLVLAKDFVQRANIGSQLLSEIV